MPNAAPITLNGTEDIVVSPDSVTGTHVVYQGLAEANVSKRVLLHFDRPSSEKATIRRTIRLAMPLVRTVDGVEKISHCTARVEFIFPVDSSLTERYELRKLIASALETEQVTALVDNPEWVW